MNEKIIENSLVTLILAALLEIENVDDVSCYKFDMKVFNNSRVKGKVKITFDEVE